MLCQFSFRNFASYHHETTFDYQAAKLTEFEESLIATEKASSLLPVSVVYGPNGGGKSNLLKALACVISLVVRPIAELEKTRMPLIFQHRIDCSPFAFDKESVHEPTEFNLYFRTGDNEYRYYISLLDDEIVSEYLYRKTIGGKRTATIFERESSNIELGSSISRRSINTKVNPKMPYLSFLSINYDLPVIAEVQTWFESCIIRNYSNPEAEYSLLLPSTSDKGSRTLVKSFIKALNDIGIDISGYRYDKEQKEFYLQRSLGGETYELPFSKESDGTQKLFAALPIIMIALSEGRFIVIDELDSKLHPKLLRYVISLFTNPRINRHGAQLLFTSHDMSTLRNDVFRRDEIWFAAMDEEHSSDLYSLFEIRTENNQRINHTAAYDKQYLEGRYGADPYLRSMLDWEALA